MSAKYKIVRDYYKNGLWNERRVRDAVIKGWITPTEFREITGKTY